jgi:hypothetical protein
MRVDFELTPDEAERVQKARAQGLDVNRLVHGLIAGLHLAENPGQARAPTEVPRDEKHESDCDSFKTSMDVTSFMYSMVGQVAPHNVIQIHHALLLTTMMSDGWVTFTQWDCLHKENTPPIDKTGP